MHSGGVRAAVLVLAFAVAAGLGLWVGAPSASAATIRQGDSVTIGPNETIRDDVYIFGSTIDIEGRVEGDVVAFGNVVAVDGEVTGDVIAGSSDVNVSGKVGGSVRAGSGTVSITGTVAEDVVAGAGRVRLGRQGTVGRDVLAGAGNLNIDGNVGRDLKAGTGTLVIAGTVGRDADVSVGTIRFAGGGRIEGDLVYRSERRQDIPGGAVGGQVTFHEMPRGGQERRSAGAGVVFWLLNWVRGYVGMAFLTLLVTLVFPLYSFSSAEEIRRRPLPSLGIGAAVFFGVPILAVIVFVIGILVGGWWLGLALIALYLIALAVAVVVASVWAGLLVLGWMKRAPSRPVLAALLGLLILWLIRLIPILGSLVLWVAMLFGLGAGVLGIWDAARRCRNVPPPVSAEEPLL